MAKAHKDKNEHPNFLHLSEMLHHMEDGVSTAYGWLAGPPMTQKQRIEQQLAETEAIRRIGTMGF